MTLSILVQSRGRDFPLWKLSSDGSFSITSIKRSIHISDQRGMDISDPNILQNLWKSCVPRKCKIFIWSLLHECINTTENLQKRLPNWNLNPNKCTLCRKAEENINHLFISCSFAKSIWEKIWLLLRININHQIPASLCKFVRRAVTKR